MIGRLRFLRALPPWVGAWTVVCLGPWRPGSAQTAPSSQIVVTAHVVAEPLLVEARRSFRFEDVYPGIAAAVDVVHAGSGQWRVTGQTGAEVLLSFDLPGQLAAGSFALPISFGPTSAAHHVGNSPQSASLFDPRAGALTRISEDRGAPELYVWIGGSVSPPIDQPPGTYSATITLTVAYTGN